LKNDCQIVRTEGVHHFDLEFMQRSLKIFAFDYFWSKRIEGEQKSKNVMVWDKGKKNSHRRYRRGAFCIEARNFVKFSKRKEKLVDEHYFDANVKESYVSGVISFFFLFRIHGINLKMWLIFIN
jgi:hypothetical protein